MVTNVNKQTLNKVLFIITKGKLAFIETFSERKSVYTHKSVYPSSNSHVQLAWLKL